MEDLKDVQNKIFNMLTEYGGIMLETAGPKALEFSGILETIYNNINKYETEIVNLLEKNRKQKIDLYFNKISILTVKKKLEEKKGETEYENENKLEQLVNHELYLISEREIFIKQYDSNMVEYQNLKKQECDKLKLFSEINKSSSECQEFGIDPINLVHILSTTRKFGKETSNGQKTFEPLISFVSLIVSLIEPYVLLLNSNMFSDRKYAAEQLHSLDVVLSTTTRYTDLLIEHGKFWNPTIINVESNLLQGFCFFFVYSIIFNKINRKTDHEN